MIETKEKTIDGVTVMVTQFPGRLSLTNKARLIKLIGPSIARIFSSDGGFSFDMLTDAIDALITRLDPSEFTRFVLDLLKCTRLDGREITDTEFDTAFAGNMPFMYKVLGFTLEVNYGSFFGEGGIGKILSKVKKTNPPTETPDVSKKSSKQSTRN
jgi:hypothetical protein